MFNINKLITRIRESDKATPPNSPGGGPNSPKSQASTDVDDADPDKNETAEGFLCPSCMEGFPSPEELSEHYESRHAADVGRLHVCPVCKTKFPTVDQLQLHYAADHPPVSRMIAAAGNDVDLRSLRQEVAELQTTLREERWYSDELKKEVGRLTDSVNRGEEPEENALMKHQLKALEESRSLLSSEVVLLRNQLADAVDTNISLKQEKETLGQKAASMVHAGERASLLAAIDEERSMKADLQNRLSEMQDLKTNLEAQLQQRPEADDVRLLRQEIVEVQTSMDKMNREHEQEKCHLQQDNEKLTIRSRELLVSLDAANTKFAEETQPLRKSLEDKSDDLKMLAKQLEERERTASELADRVQTLEKIIASKDVDFQREAEVGSTAAAERNALTKQLGNTKSDFEASREECERLKMQLNELDAEKSLLKEREQVTSLEVTQRTEQINDLKHKLDEVMLVVQERDSQLGSSRKQLSTLKSHFQAQSSEVNDVKTQLRELKLELENEQRSKRNEEEKVKELESEFVRRSESVAKLESERLELYAKIEAGDGANEAIHQLRQKELALTEDLLKSQQTVARQTDELARLNDELHRRLQEYKLQSETDREKLSKSEAELKAMTEQLAIQEERCNQLEESVKTKSKAYQSSEASWNGQRLEMERSLQALKSDCDAKSVELEAFNVKLARTSDDLVAAIESRRILETNLQNEKQTVSHITYSLEAFKAQVDEQKLQLGKKCAQLDRLEQSQAETNHVVDELTNVKSELSKQIENMESAAASKDNRVRDLEVIYAKSRSKEDQLEQQLNAAGKILTDTIKEINSGLREEPSCFNSHSDGTLKYFEKDLKNLDRALIDSRKIVQHRDENEKQLNFRVDEMESQIMAYKLEMAELLVILDSKKAEVLDQESRLSDMQESAKQKQTKLNELDTIVKETATSLLASEAKCKRQEEELEGLRTTSENMSSALQHTERQLNDIRGGLARLSNKELDAAAVDCDEQLLKQLLAKAEDVKRGLEDRVSTLGEELDASNQSLQSNMLQKTSLETELFDAQTNLVDLEESQARLRQEIHDLYQQVAQETEDKKKKIAELEEAIRRANKLQNKLLATETQYTQEVASHEETQNTLELEVERLEQRTSDVSSQLADALAAKDSLAQEAEQLKSIFEAQVGTLTENLSALRSELVNEQDKSETLEKKVDGLSGDKLEFEAKLENLLDERRALLERCLSSESECEKLRSLTVELRRKLDDALSALHELGRENQTLQLETAKHVNRKWASDSEVDSCTLCLKIFSVTNRKHHCRNCGNIFCNECSAHNATVPAHKKPVRVCDTCFGELGTK